jgi:hypothetical protein
MRSQSISAKQAPHRMHPAMHTYGVHKPDPTWLMVLSEVCCHAVESSKSASTGLHLSAASICGCGMPCCFDFITATLHELQAEMCEI